MVLKVNESNYATQVVESTCPVLIDFRAEWCGPCRMLAPVVAAVAEQRPDIKVCEVDVDESSALASKYGVMSIPALFLVEHGKVVKSTVGAMSESELLSWLSS